jgi:putative addiction module component (TIGR02574 family)
MPLTLEQFGLDRLSVAERLKLLALIWDSLPDSEPVSPPEWHLRELERRRAAEEAPGLGEAWEAVKTRLW